MEFVRESHAETAGVLAAYTELLAGRISPQEATARAEADTHYGVSRSPMVLTR